MAKAGILSSQERQSYLRDAAQKYAKGHISPEQFEAIERRYGPNYRAGTAAIAWHSLNPIVALRKGPGNSRRRDGCFMPILELLSLFWRGKGRVD